MNDPQKSPLERQYSSVSAPASAGFAQESQPNLIIAVIAGGAAAFIGALIWAGVSYLTGYQIGWMAVGIGFLVGFAVRFGRGESYCYNFLGAALALIGCMMGNALMVIAYASKGAEMGMFEVFSRLGVDGVVELMKLTFPPMDLLFYAIATYEGWRFSTRPEVGENG